MLRTIFIKYKVEVLYFIFILPSIQTCLVKKSTFRFLITLNVKFNILCAVKFSLELSLSMNM